jgi:predicted dehydrogenase
MPKAMTEDREIRWGILGAGGIAEKLANDIGITPGNEVVAVGARDADRAADFARRHGAARSYGSYEALVADEEVDVVYVSTTHPYHLTHSLLAIGAGKAVLVEKPVALNARDARRLFQAAADADVFAMEAMWMRINPLVVRAQELIAEGAIGDVRAVRFEFGLGIAFDASHRLYDIDNGGGALLDLGVYPASFAYHFLGRPDEVRTSGTLAPNGVDDTVYMEWLYGGVPRAQLWCSIPVIAPNRSAVMGDRGWLEFEPEAYRPTGLTVHAGDDEYTIGDPLAGQGFGYGPEIEEVERCLRAGLAQCPSIPVEDTVAILEVLDGARASLGVTYPGESGS